MGRYNTARFKPVMVPMDVYLRLLARKRGPLDSLGEVIRRLLDERESVPLESTRIVHELAHEAPRLHRLVESRVFSYALKPTKVKIQNE